jgi:hypothetical protein
MDSGRNIRMGFTLYIQIVKIKRAAAIEEDRKLNSFLSKELKSCFLDPLNEPVESPLPILPVPTVNLSFI